ncbi:Guanine deaminase [Aspergillus sclerotialis]|uniref:Guanine deaminase n=1 Tax=Aspergillus sclerotialis TaxID=2070753 RepID=A0A3A2ZF85_9EURO|nr:Guanine deaminase [Aspergillus sclerotialis]
MSMSETATASHCKIFHGATIITVDKRREVIHNGYIRIDGDRITAVGKCPYTGNLPIGARKVDCQGKIIIPGLINIHAHLVQSLLRGLAEDLPLHNWLCDAVWPLEAVFAEDDGYHAARLTMAEMLKTGTTCFLDPMLTYRAGFDQICAAVGEMGNRGCLSTQGKLVKFTETNRQLSISDPRDQDLLAMSIPELLNAHGKHHNSHHGRIHVWAAAGTPRGASIAHYLELGETCSVNGISVTMHCDEAPRDRIIYRETYGRSAMEFVRDAKLCPQPKDLPDERGSMSHHLVLAHMVNIDDIDIPLLASTQTSVAHNPTSNLKLASGVAPIPQMVSGSFPVNVALGTDGGPCCNHYDMFQEMHLAGILHKGVNHDASLIPAELALEMATINGARALGMENEIGSLEVGKKADLVVVDPYGQGGLGAAPWNSDFLNGAASPVTTVVHSCTGRDVDMTVVNGDILVEGNSLTRGGKDKEREIVRAAQHAVKGLLLRCNEGREDSAKVGGKLMATWSYY